MDQSIKQFPVDLDKAGLYAWTLIYADGRIDGHIVVRGPEADPINGWTEYEAGNEYWYSGDEQTGGASPGKFTVTLVLHDEPDDGELVAAVGEVRDNETLMGEQPMVPNWTSGAPLPGDPVVYTETEVKNGPGSYDDLYEHVSILMPVDSGAPLMPTLYTDLANLFSIFGGSATNPNFAQGIEATFTEVDEGEDGWPEESSWEWTGRDPS